MKTVFNVGASLLAIAVCQPTKMLTMTPPSRAGSLPQVLVVFIRRWRRLAQAR